MRRLAVLILTLAPSLVSPCELALVLAVDVSGSVDQDEYHIQMGGLAAALQDGIVADALVEQKAALSVVQWSGSSRQVQTIPWTRIASHADVAGLATAIAQDPRLWRNYSTAIGEALTLSMNAFDAVPLCRRRVIDVSGDGLSNEGLAPMTLHAELRERGILVNALAIETDETDLAAYFYENVIVGEGAFVVTANGFQDYPAQIRRKLQREITKQFSLLRAK